ncbi:MAG: hypothetical protein HYZ42_09320 [Bacteroidetes bacterium]|nr:hypothetical protein [Bacteroidota bacterium]
MSTVGQTYSTLVSDGEITSFLDWQLKTEKKYSEEPRNKTKYLYKGISKWNMGMLRYYISYSKKDKWIEEAFSKNDTSFLFQQIFSQVDTLWRHSFSNSKLIKQLRKNRQPRRPNRYYLSLPLFSMDKNFVIISVSYICGRLCGHGGYKVYKRVSYNNWKYVGEVNGWIS